MRLRALTLLAAMLPLGGLPACAGPGAAADGRVRTVRHLDVPGHTAEILKYAKREKVILSTDGPALEISLTVVESWSGPALRPLDLDPARPGVQGVPMPGEPTGCAAHPFLPIGFAVCRPGGPAGPGRLLGFDLREDAPRRILLDQPLGPGPDSLAVSGDGRWAIVAIEGEGDPDVPGAIEAIDLSSLLGGDDPAGPLPSRALPGLGALLGASPGDVEPEFVAMDPSARFAAVSCQEQDAVVLVSLGDAPRLAGAIFLGDGAAPDGVAVLDGVLSPDGQPGALVAVAEEGRKRRGGGRSGNAASFWWVDPDHLHREPVLLSRVDVRPLVDAGRPYERRDPEGVDLARAGERVLAVLGIERGNLLLALDVTDARNPGALGLAGIADRPEGVIAISLGDRVVAVAGCEGEEGPGMLSFVEVRP